MATGRTLDKYKRVYVDGYDWSGFSRSAGPLELTYDEADLTAPMSDTVKGYLRNHPQVNVGTLNAVFTNTATTGLHAQASASGGVSRTVLVAQGIQGAPADGDPCFGGQFIQDGEKISDDGGAVTATIPFLGWSASASTLQYAGPWGDLLHALAIRLAATGVNAANSGISNPTGGQTLKGGYFLYQVTAGDGTATLSVDDSANNAAWVALAGATSGSIDCATPKYGIVALPNTGASATVRQYLRWQIAFGTATTVTFVSAFMRAY